MSDEAMKDMQNPKSLILEIIERLTKVETRLENTATKADLKQVETDFKQMGTHLLNWLIGTLLACFMVLGAFLKYF